LQNWPRSPFTEVDILTGSAKGWVEKRQQRKAVFERLSNLVQMVNFDAVAVGSDRRIEFQYVMQLCRKKQKASQTKGWYLDDGLYSYAGRPHHWLKDGLNGLLKKLSYGFWWQEPKTVGASAWIDTVWLFDPCNANIQLKNKHAEKLDVSWFKHRRITEYSQKLFSLFGINDDLTEKLVDVDVCLLVPHPNNIEKMSGYAGRIDSLKKYVADKNLKLAVKYHPRTEGVDPLNLVQDSQALLVPANLAFEFFLTQLNQKTKLIGDVGTSLLTAKWLRPDLIGVAVITGDSQMELGTSKVLQQHSVAVKSNMVEALEYLDE